MAADAGIAHAIPAEGDYPGVSRTSQNEGTYEKIRVQVWRVGVNRGVFFGEIRPGLREEFS
eukprot:341536-Amorphochlora_amoeboformis.AAC.1